MEFIVAEIERGVDGFERFEVNIDFSLLALRSQDFTTIHDETIGGDLVVKLQALLCRRNGGQDRLSIDTRLDIRCRTLENG